MKRYYIGHIRNIHSVLFSLLLILLPTQLGRHYWPHWSLVLGRRIDYLSPTLYLTDILVLAVVGTYVGCIGLHVLSRRARPLTVPISIAIAFAIYNTLRSVSIQVAIFAWIRVFECALLAWYVRHSRVATGHIVRYVSIGMLLTSIPAILQFVFQKSIGGIWWWFGERAIMPDTPGAALLDWCPPFLNGCPLILRSYGTFPHPNVLGGYLAAGLVLIAGFVVTSRVGYRDRVLLYAAGIVSFAALVVTFSRSAWFAACVSVISLGIAGRTYMKPWWRFVVVCMVVSIASVVFLTYTGLSVQENESLEDRVGLAGSAIELFRISPISGIGVSNMLVRLPDTESFRTHMRIQPVHSVYLLALTELGLLGSVLILFAAVSFAHSHRLYSRIAPLRAASVPYFAILVLLVAGSFDHYPLTIQQGRLLLSILIGMAAGSVSRG